MDDEALDHADWLDRHRVQLPPVPDDAIVGVGHALDACRSVLGRLTHAAEMAAAGADTPRGLLFAGPSGTGKTLTARWVAGRLGDGVAAYDLPTETLTADRVRGAWAVLAGRPRSVVFLPEVDAVGLDPDTSARPTSPQARQVLYALLEALDGLRQADLGRGPIVIATTNAPVGAFVPALLRPGRLGVHVRFALPGEAEREALFARMASGRPCAPDVDWRLAARLTRGWSPAEVRAALDEALGSALARGDASLGLADIIRAIRVRGEVERAGARPEDARRTAIHEAGHAVVAAALGQSVATMRIGAGHRSGSTETDEEDAPLLDSALRAGPVVAMAGIAAESLILGEAGAGGSSDVRRATSMLLERVAAGLDPEVPPVSTAAFGYTRPPALDNLIALHVARRLELAREDAAAVVEAHAGAIERLAELLLAAPAQMLAGDALATALRDAGAADDRAAA